VTLKEGEPRGEAGDGKASAQGCAIFAYNRPFHLGQLAEGAVEEIPAKIWREQLGMAARSSEEQDETGSL